MRKLFFGKMIATALFVTTQFAHAQSNYPVKPIRVVVPYPAGGTSDILTRLVGQKLTEAWGQQVISDSRPGDRKSVV